MAQETVLITGASSGIGRELAKCFAADGSRLALVARSGGELQALADEMRKLHQVEARIFAMDLTRPEAPSHLLSHLETAGLKVDVLVNNAGFGAQGLFAEIPLDRQLQMVQLNITTLTHLTRLLLPGMITRGRGGILNVASTAAFQPGPHMAVYYATKAYVLSLSEALTEELSRTGLTVTVLCPGPTQTNFFAAAELRGSKLTRMGVMAAEDVARIGYRAFRRRRAVAIAGFHNRLLAFSVRLTPRAVARKIAGMLNAAKT
jgi:short-subunit dehydrogenase